MKPDFLKHKNIFQKTEIEFKFLVDSLPKQYDEKQKISQIYFKPNKVLALLKEIFDNVIITKLKIARIRIITQNGKAKYLVNLKSNGLIIREEFEKEISKEVAFKLYKNNQISRIEKTRYVVRKSGFTFEFDEYENLSYPLKTVEVEVEANNLNQKRQKIITILNDEFNLKIKDVTFNVNYKNSNLARESFTHIKNDWKWLK